jgi:hypothetical protein
MKSSHDQIADRCIHFNGIMNDVCRAGVIYPNTKNLQCIRNGDNWKSSCSKCEMPDEEYIDSIESEINKSIERMEKIDPLVNRIKTKYKGKDWTGIEICPICGGKLHMSHVAYNGHTAGKCETVDCVAWLE